MGAVKTHAAINSHGRFKRRAPVANAIILTIPLLFGCQYDPFAHRYATEKPSEADVAGSYELVQQTVTTQGLAAMEGRPCEVELHANGTFAATNIPPRVLDAPGKDFFHTLISGTGTWRIDKVGSLDNGFGKLKPIWGVYLDSNQAEFISANLTRNSSPHGLIFGLGDPDAGQVMILEKVKR